MDARGPFAAAVAAAWTSVAGQEVLWPGLTLVLSAAVVVAYVVIAFNWRIQSRLSRSAAEAKASLARLGAILGCCTVCGYAFARTDAAWWLWRLYDLVLLLLAVLAWRFVARMRGGMRLV